MPTVNDPVTVSFPFNVIPPNVGVDVVAIFCGSDNVIPPVELDTLIWFVVPAKLLTKPVVVVSVPTPPLAMTIPFAIPDNVNRLNVGDEVVEMFCGSENVTAPVELDTVIWFAVPMTDVTRSFDSATTPEAFDFKNPAP